jgi:membrane protein YqaA with SNARE-associated domain
VILFAPIGPTILSPLAYSLTGALLVQKANPRILSVVAVSVSTLAAILVRAIQNHIIEKMSIYEKIDSKHRFHLTVNRINKYFKNHKRIIGLSLRREKYIETKDGRLATFLFAIFCFLPVLPDIICIRLLYKKIKFPSFVGAVIIGKIITFVPFIFL